MSPQLLWNLTPLAEALSILSGPLSFSPLKTYQFRSLSPDKQSLLGLGPQLVSFSSSSSLSSRCGFCPPPRCSQASQSHVQTDLPLQPSPGTPEIRLPFLCSHSWMPAPEAKPPEAETLLGSLTQAFPGPVNSMPCAVFRSIHVLLSPRPLAVMASVIS